MILSFRWLLVGLLFAYPIFAWNDNKTISPLEYGLKDCISDIQRYYVLQEVHNDAAKLGCGVDYSGIDTINIEIPQDAKMLPLTNYTDFGGVVLIVKNQKKNMALFQMSQRMMPMDVTWNKVIKGRIPKQKDYLLIIEDQESWVKNRIGYKYGHIRKDILLVEDGRIQNKVVASYGTASSKPKFLYCDVVKGPKVIKNLTVNRDTTSTYITNIFSVENQNDVLLETVTINTPSPGELYGDVAIRINNCTNVMMKDIIINGTYSQQRRFGYGIAMDNVWNVTFDHLVGHGNWGIFGNNNVNKATLVNCDINRFDIHCYGRDVVFENCTFRDLYNQFSSVYGIISFNHCQFLDFIPILFETSYNAYTGFDLSFRDCTWQMKRGQSYLIQTGNLYGKENERAELKEKCWPNLDVRNMKVVVPETMETIYLYGCKAKPKTDVKLGYINVVKISNIRILNNKGEQTKTKIILSDQDVAFKHRLVSNVPTK